MGEECALELGEDQEESEPVGGLDRGREKRGELKETRRRGRMWV